MLAGLPESTVTTELWRRLGASALDEESLDRFLSESQQGDENTAEAFRQQVAVAAWATASAGEAADARFLRRLLKGQGMGDAQKTTPLTMVHLKAGLVAPLAACQP